MIAAGVAVAIVDLLEVVDIGDEEGERVPEAEGEGEFRTERLLEVAGVVEAGLAVDLRQGGQVGDARQLVGHDQQGEDQQEQEGAVQPEPGECDAEDGEERLAAEHGRREERHAAQGEAGMQRDALGEEQVLDQQEGDGGEDDTAKVARGGGPDDTAPVDPPRRRLGSEEGGRGVEEEGTQARPAPQGQERLGQEGEEDQGRQEIEREDQRAG